MQEKEEKIPIVHIYGQLLWHDYVLIVGNKEGLNILKNVIDEALKNGKAKTEEYPFCNDGVRYPIIIIFEEAKDFIDGLPVPYTDKSARDLDFIKKFDATIEKKMREIK